MANTNYKILLVVSDRTERMKLISVLSEPYELQHGECELHVRSLTSTGTVFDLALVENSPNGLRIAEVLEERNPSTPIISLLSNGQSDDMPMSSGFILKPSNNLSKLLNLVSGYLTNRQIEPPALVAA